MNNKILTLVLVVIVLVAIIFGMGVLLLQKNQGGQPVPVTTIPTTTAINPSESTQTPTIPTATIVVVDQGPTIPAGWQTYTNTQYGFTVSYPSPFKALTDKDNLYGWPNAIVLFYGGGQSYDIVVEVWDTETQYQQKYPGINLAVYQINNKFLTLTDQNDTPENKAIIATFQFIK